MHISSLFKHLFKFKSTKYPIICKKDILCIKKNGFWGSATTSFFTTKNVFFAYNWIFCTLKLKKMLKKRRNVHFLWIYLMILKLFLLWCIDYHFSVSFQTNLHLEIKVSNLYKLHCTNASQYSGNMTLIYSCIDNWY